VTAYLRWARCVHHLSLDRAASLIGVAARTLQSWVAQKPLDRSTRRPRGRPPEGLSRESLQILQLLLFLMGPQTGVPTLQALLPQVPRREIDLHLRRFRQQAWLGRESLAQVLRWDQRGAVWAMDFSDPPSAIDARFKRLLLVRDLASGNQLAALPINESTSINVLALLTALFLRHGPPLVIKCDNGSQFLTPDVLALLVQWHVELLRSPPSCPRYNGSCEAGIGSIKTRAHHIAAREGRPGAWTCDDVEEARLQANETARPLGAGSPSPDELWARRARVENDERGTFQQTVRIFKWEVIGKQARLPGIITDREQAQIDREAVTRALLYHGILTIARRRFTQPIPRRFRANIR
jgi:hypothetical protein